MGEYSRPATIDDFKALIASLNEQDADYLLIGGYALFAHGYHRATTVIDVLVRSKGSWWCTASSMARACSTSIARNR